MTRRAGQTLLGAGTITFLVLAVVLGVAAFTRFEQAPPDNSTAQEIQDWNDGAMATAFTSAALGVSSAFSLLAAFTCGQRYQSNRPPPE